MPFTLEELKKIQWIKYREAVIIGWWRMGAPVHIIAAIEGVYHYEVEEIIKDHNQQNKTYVQENYSNCKKSCSQIPA